MTNFDRLFVDLPGELISSNSVAFIDSSGVLWLYGDGMGEITCSTRTGEDEVTSYFEMKEALGLRRIEVSERVCVYPADSNTSIDELVERAMTVFKNNGFVDAERRTKSDSILENCVSKFTYGVDYYE